MPQVTSRDGTSIAYDRSGEGPVVILVGGALDDGSENAPLATELSGEFTVVNYSRRGRGRSGDAQPYAPEREVEDLAALIDEVGAPAHLFGASSGGALVLAAVAAGLPVGRVVVYEVPYQVGDEAVRVWQEYVTRLRDALGDGRRDEALRLFMRLAGAPEESVEEAAASPMWPALLDLAPTLGHDAACLGDGPPPPWLATVTRPTLALTGAGTDPHTPGLTIDFFGDAADAIAAAVPGAERGTVETHEHAVNAKILAPVLARFFHT
ncbi:alpha/beta hydrolase [Microtetraspora sp. NBRC 13810]|uniref:alpha/beta fold hydrolase n=1 Tax=Microtetraspora sp. NBRC 13810 TaxID=3030990 RepID=UPI0025574EE4|nr:alpha/beta hydrolase [Microtetraspora sp. NBRC 13810]GLW10162.1 alpha/beta hydrolase [Microtetraspora sp. NBRC 13810]